MTNSRRVALFVATGALNTGFGLAVYTIFYLFGFPIWLIVSLSMIAALIFNFVTYGGIVFRKLSHRTFPKFAVFYIALATLNTVLLHYLAHYSISPVLAQAFLALPLAILSYLALNLIVFRPSESTNPEAKP